MRRASGHADAGREGEMKRGAGVHLLLGAKAEVELAGRCGKPDLRELPQVHRLTGRRGED